MKSTLQKLLVVTMLTIQVFFYPVIAFAETSPAATASPQAQSSDQSQTSASAEKPTGPEAPTYIFNPATGLWENDYYTWNPVTRQASPKTPPTYSYNSTTGMWDTTEYKYDAVAGTYTAQPVSAPKPPTTAAAIPAPSTQPNVITPAAPPTGSAATQAPAASTDTASAYDLFYNNTISNTITSNAQSGDAQVTGNTTAGNATTGNASSIANVLNMLQSSLGTQPNSVNTFTTDIYGTQFGDLTLDPNKLAKAGQLDVKSSINPDLTINIGQNNTIANNINLTAASGNTLVEGNINAGNASSGDALAVANVVNMINSSISTGQSFIGNINIYGDLDGDILLPDSVKQQLLSGNTPTATIDTTKIENANIVANLTTNTQINNAVSTTATTGNATVSGNTTAGNAKTGNASTNLTVLNLTGQEVIGDNALLVFVNVMGKWVGAIMNAPNGTTAATLGSQGSSITSSGTVSVNSNVTNTIDNTINVQAASGDAAVNHNTQAGDATSGNASAGANLANIANSSFSLADWFGVLFINVFGSWNGSFGQDTVAGGLTQSNSPPAVPANPGTTVPTDQVRAFVISNKGGSYKLAAIAQPQLATPTQTAGNNTEAQKQNTPQVLGTSTNSTTPPTSISNTSSKGMPWPVAASMVAFVVGIVLMVIERILTARHRTHAHTNTPMTNVSSPIPTVHPGDSLAA